MSRSAAPVVPGFRAAGIHCGIKQSARDLALIASDVEASVAGVFTRSTVVGAPVELCRERVRAGRGRAVVINSGVSNVSMGERGRRDAARMAELAARAVGCEAEHVFVASTGVIGVALPMPKLRAGIPELARALRPDGLAEAAEAIMTTDTFAKIASTKLSLGGRRISIAGIAKGSGMIEPNLATMLSFLLTDAAASPAFLRGLLKRVADLTYNRTTVDGETSTSDSVLLFANGVAGQPRLTSRSSPGAAAFEDAVREVAEQLARALARDGEGATKLVTVDIRGARGVSAAAAAAKRIANSLLVKTALFGGDPNWGRIVQTLGAGRTQLDEARMVVKLCGVTVYRRGSSTGPAARRRAEQRMVRDEISIEVDLGVGAGAARVWTCDLSYDYVRINADYTT